MHRNRAAGVSPYGPNHSRSNFNPRVDTYINEAAFPAPPAFTFGDAPVYDSHLRTFGYKHWDAALMKRMRVRENVNLTFEAEFFNVLNTTNFGTPASNIDSAAFGQVTSINGNSRNGQMSLTLSF